MQWHDSKMTLQQCQASMIIDIKAKFEETLSGRCEKEKNQHDWFDLPCQIKSSMQELWCDVIICTSKFVLRTQKKWQPAPDFNTPFHSCVNEIVLLWKFGLFQSCFCAELNFFYTFGFGTDMSAPIIGKHSILLRATVHTTLQSTPTPTHLLEAFEEAHISRVSGKPTGNASLTTRNGGSHQCQMCQLCIFNEGGDRWVGARILLFSSNQPSDEEDTQKLECRLKCPPVVQWRACAIPSPLVPFLLRCGRTFAFWQQTEEVI